MVVKDEDWRIDLLNTCEDFKRGADHDWVCVECFHDFKDRMGWHEAT
jgi:hypothetical protein